MNKALLLSNLNSKVMAVPGMDLSNDSGFVIDESPARDLHRTHFRFTSNEGLCDEHNGNAFTKYLTEQGVMVEQRRPKLVVVADTELARVFKL